MGAVMVVDVGKVIGSLDGCEDVNKLLLLPGVDHRV